MKVHYHVKLHQNLTAGFQVMGSFLIPKIHSGNYLSTQKAWLDLITARFTIARYQTPSYIFLVLCRQTDVTESIVASLVWLTD